MGEAKDALVTMVLRPCNQCGKEVWAMFYTQAEFNGFACEECINNKLKTILTPIP